MATNVARRIDLTRERSLIDEDVVEVVLEAMAPYGWPSSKEHIRHERLFLGLTNNLYVCEVIEPEAIRNVPDARLTKVVVRIFGNNSDLLVDRDHEVKVLTALSKTRACARLLATFTNGLVVEFVPGDNIQSADIRGRLTEIIAVELAHFHRAEFPSTDTNWLWDTLERYHASVVQEYGQYSITVEGVGSFTLDDIAAEIQQAKATLSKSTLPVVCSHNDINYQNILYDAPSHSVAFIDFEYASLNYQGFDLGNHFCEYAGVDVELDFETYYPNKELQVRFIKAYLQRYLDRAPTADEVDALFTEANEFAMMSHLLWALWSLIQARHSTIDFRFDSYAEKRLGTYYTRKQQNGCVSMLPLHTE